MSRYLSLLVALAFVVPPVVAQPRLAVSSDVLFFPSDSTFTVTNEGADSLTLSFPLTSKPSLYFGTVEGYFWYFKVETPDTEAVARLPRPVEDDPPIFTIAPGESAAFRIIEFDPYPAAGKRHADDDLKPDTLYLEAVSGGDTLRADIVLDVARYVSVEQPFPPRTPSLAVYPNPAQEHVTVVLEARGATRAVVAVYDLLGREVRRYTGGISSGQPRQADLTGLSAGAYVIQVQFEDGSVVQEPFVIASSPAP